jgi:flagellar biosynthesis chaperone FliJ
MAVSRALRRLVRVRDLEEEQCKMALESAMGELNRLENALASSTERGRQGQRLFQVSACNGELPGRLAGIEETHTSKRYATVLTPRIEAKKRDVTSLREDYLAKRVERRQAETLIQEQEVQEAIEAGRRGQQVLDDWYSSRRYRQELEAEMEHPGDPGSVQQELPSSESKNAAKNTLAK